jgi:hypothetical protein
VHRHPHQLILKAVVLAVRVLTQHQLVRRFTPCNSFVLKALQ